MSPNPETLSLQTPILTRGPRFIRPRTPEPPQEGTQGTVSDCKWVAMWVTVLHYNRVWLLQHFLRSLPSTFALFPFVPTCYKAVVVLAVMIVVVLVAAVVVVAVVVVAVVVVVAMHWRCWWL